MAKEGEFKVECQKLRKQRLRGMQFFNYCGGESKVNKSDPHCPVYLFMGLFTQILGEGKGGFCPSPCDCLSPKSSLRNEETYK